jgi:6-phospho-beta-glucosidase
MRLVVLGGSGSSTPELFDALADWPGGLDRRPPLEVVLVGRTSEKLSVVVEACAARIADGSTIDLSGDTDRRRALVGADVVLNQVRVGGYPARAFDETFPWRFDLPGEETMGPGGFANSVRTVPALRTTWDDVAEVAPDALVVNLTNPSGIVQAVAKADHPELNVISVCDSPMPVLDRIADRLGRPRGEIWSRYVGMNHLGWYVPDGSEPSAELDRIADLAVGCSPEDVRLLEALPAPYVRYYMHPGPIFDQQRRGETRAAVLQRVDASLLSAYRADPHGEVQRRGAVVWYRLAVLGLLDAWLHGTDEIPMIAGVLNSGKVPWLPPNVVLELPHRGTPRQLVPLEPITLPPLPAALLAAQGAYESLTIAALRRVPAGPSDDAGRDRLIRALMANPLVRGVDQAKVLLTAIEEQSKADDRMTASC